MTKRNFKWSILFALLITLFIFIVACTQKEPISVDSPDYNQETFMNLAEMEQTLENFASVLPEALTDLELSKIVYDEAKRNEEDEPYALWSEIADISTQSGKTLRKEVQNVLEKRSLGKLASAESLTAAMDEVDYLQVYIHSFEEWDGGSTIPATFTPLTINDVDVTELTTYDTLGSTYTLEVDTIPPYYPLMIVGLNEDMDYHSDYDSTFSLGKITTGPNITIKEVKLDRSAWAYEPWWKGKAELYFRVYDKEASNDDRWYAGYLSPDGNHKSYKCWKWKTWHYVQNRPWRTISLNTGWAASTFLNENRNFSLKLIEYDPIFYDLGENSQWWCALYLSPIIFAPGECIYWILVTVGCSITWNDEIIGCGDDFESIVLFAKGNLGQEITWDTGHYRIKIIAQ